MKIFGREPVYWLALIAIVLKLSSAYGLDVSVEEQAAVMTVLSLAVAVANAVVLKTGAVGACIVNLAQGALACFLAFGVEMSAETLALWGMGVEAVVALFIHREVTAPQGPLPVEQKSPINKPAPAAG